MAELKPWVRGPFELIRHAEGHLKLGSDFDKRMALISFDNAIEVAITTYLRLHPSQRRGKTYPRESVDKWVANYHSKLGFFFEDYVKGVPGPLRATQDEIVWYHDLRNDLYHSGNGLVPEEENLCGARTSALWVFTALFGVDVERMLAEVVFPPVQAVNPGDAPLPAQMRFLQSFIGVEKSLSSALQSVDLPNSARKRPASVREYWGLFTSKVPVLERRYRSIIERAQAVRNALVHGQPSGTSGEELVKLSTTLDKIAEFVGNYAFSFDILGVLKSRYPQWLRPDITSARIVQREGAVFLEIVAKKDRVREEVIRTDLSFIKSRRGRKFSPSRTAYENAELLVRKLDPYSIINCTQLFKLEAWDQVEKLYGPQRKP